MDVLIRDLDADTHAELARRAKAADVSLRAYLHEVLTLHVAVPSVEQWLADVAELVPIDGAPADGATLVAEARAEDGRPAG